MKSGSKMSIPVYKGLMSVKSKYMAEFRRFSLNIEEDDFKSFHDQIRHLHRVDSTDVVLTYTDPVHGDLLPINNDENFTKAKQLCGSSLLMKVYIHKRDNYVVSNGYGSVRRSKGKKKVPVISLPENFRPVSAIIDVDILPESLRRVRLHNPRGNKLIGFYIRDSVRLQVTGKQAEKVPGISIHKLVPGGLAEMTGLLAVDDEILEVNGIEVVGKSLDQVTDMMVANSNNLVVTVRPASLHNLSSINRSSMKHASNDRRLYTTGSSRTANSHTNHGSDDEDDDDEVDEGDIVRDLREPSFQKI